jgi:hypothetical protein
MYFSSAFQVGNKMDILLFDVIVVVVSGTVPTDTSAA